jgi:type I restriction enzyme S subunit
VSAVAEPIAAATRVVPLIEAVELNPRAERAALSDDLEVSFVPMAAVEAGSGRMDATAVRWFGDVKKGYTTFREGDVLFAKITPCMENGKMAVARGLRNGVGCGSTEFHVLRPRPGVDAHYVYHFVSSASFRGEAAHHMTGAVGQKRVPVAFLERCEIPLPGLDEQRRIVAEIEKQFSRLDEAVANLKRVKSNLKRYKAAVLKAAAEGRLVPTEAELARTEGRMYESGAELLVRILEERRASWAGRYELPLRAEVLPAASLPDGWTWCTVSQLMRERIVNGLSIKESPHPTATRALRLSALTEEGLDYFDHRFLPIEPGQVGDITVQAGDFFVSRGNGSLELVGRGATAQAPPHPVIFPDTMMRVRFLSGEVARWVQMLWPSRLVRSQIESRVKTTAGIYKISQPQVASIIVPLPPVDDQRRILATVDHRLSSIRRASHEVETSRVRAEALRQSVLARSFLRPKTQTLRGDVGVAL